MRSSSNCRSGSSCDAVGRAPRNGEILQRHGTGPHRVVIENGGSAEAVVKMRDEHRRTALTVYVGPYGTGGPLPLRAVPP